MVGIMPPSQKRFGGFFLPVLERRKLKQDSVVLRKKLRYNVDVVRVCNQPFLGLMINRNLKWRLNVKDIMERVPNLKAEETNKQPE